MRLIHRGPSRMLVQNMEQFSLAAPIETHRKEISCKEAGCAQHERGWKTIVNEATTLGQEQAHYIRRESGRHYTEMRELAGVATFVFLPGQSCFGTHTVSLEREPFFTHRLGDWRAAVSRPILWRPRDWVEKFAGKLDTLKRRIEGG